VDVNQLERFLKIGDAGSFRAAARALGLSQATLSFSMQQLEAELGGSLFERSGSGTRLTALGVALRPGAALMVNQANRLRADADVIVGRGAPQLNVGTTETLGSSVIAPAAVALLARMPEVRLHVSHADSETMLGKLRASEFDLVVCSPKSGADYAGLEFEKTHQERFVMAARAQHPLFRGGKEPPPDALSGQRLVVHEAANSLAVIGDGQRLQEIVGTQVRVPSHALVRQLLLTTDLLGYVAEDLIRDDVLRGAVRVLDVAGLTHISPSGLLVRKGTTPTPAAKAFCREVRLVCRALRSSRS
jgi:LysR family transcriptional regulator of gallate degradation